MDEISVTPTVGLEIPDTFIGIVTPDVLLSGIVNGPVEELKVCVIIVGGIGVPPVTTPLKSFINPTQIGFVVADAVTVGAGVTVMIIASLTGAQPAAGHGVNVKVYVPVVDGVKVVFKLLTLPNVPDPKGETVKFERVNKHLDSPQNL
jgi:hypothetical protein